MQTDWGGGSNTALEKLIAREEAALSTRNDKLDYFVVNGMYMETF
jgi:hypothetical protein